MTNKTTFEHPELPALPQGEHYARVTFSRAQCAHNYDSPAQVAADFCRDADLDVVAARTEYDTVAVYVREPAANDARGWDAYRALRCTSAQRVAS